MADLHHPQNMSPHSSSWCRPVSHDPDLRLPDGSHPVETLSLRKYSPLPYQALWTHWYWFSAVRIMASLCRLPSAYILRTSHWCALPRTVLHNCTGDRIQMHTAHPQALCCPHLRSFFWSRRLLLLPLPSSPARSYSLLLPHFQAPHALRRIPPNHDPQLLRCWQAPPDPQGCAYSLPRAA